MIIEDVSFWNVWVSLLLSSLSGGWYASVHDYMIFKNGIDIARLISRK